MSYSGGIEFGRIMQFANRAVKELYYDTGQVMEKVNVVNIFDEQSNGKMQLREVL
jgi:hypothetical protein